MSSSTLLMRQSAKRCGIHAASMASVGLSSAETARQRLVTPLTAASWTQRLDDEGPDTLVQVREAVHRFPELVTMASMIGGLSISWLPFALPQR